MTLDFSPARAIMNVREKTTRNAFAGDNSVRDRPFTGVFVCATPY